MADNHTARPWPRPRPGSSLRFRLTAVATVVVGLVLALTAVVLLDVQRRQVTANLDASLEQRANTIADNPDLGTGTVSLTTNDEDRAIQVVAEDGRILANSPNLDGEPPLTESLGAVDQTIRTALDLPLEDDAFRVLSRRIDTSAGPAVLHVAENTDDLNETIRNLTIALAITIPAVTLALGGLMWWLTGRTLMPVERMRAQVDSITTSNSDQRILVPARHDEIGRLGVTMNRMLDRLGDATERQRQFVADAAHELRTPLTRIRTSLDVELAHPDEAKAIETLTTVRQEAIGLQNLVDDLLHLARADADETPRRRDLIDVDDLVMAEIREVRATSPSVAIDAAGVSAAQVQGNPDHLRRAVRNLLTNAVRHAETTVTVALSEHETSAELSITDDGPGVPDTHTERIFERFTRVEDARSSQDGGTGLGLAIAREIIESHGGTIRYDTDHHHGARFELRIPVVDGAPPKSPA